MTGLDTGPFVYGKRDRAYLNPGFIVWSGPELLQEYKETMRRADTI